MLYDLLIGIQYLGILGLFIECVIVVKRLRTSLHAYILLSCIAALVNNIGYLLELSAKTEESYVMALQLSYGGRAWFSFALFLFVTELCRIKIPRPVKTLLFLIHATTFVSILTLRKHKLYYTDLSFSMKGDFPSVVHGNGIIHHCFMALQAVYILLGLFMLGRALRKERREMARKRISIVIVSIAAQGLFFAAQMIGIPGLKGIYDCTMLGNAVGTQIMLIAILSFDLLGTEDLAREFVIDRISEGIIAIDPEGKIQYVNEPARRLFPMLNEEEGEKISETKKEDRERLLSMLESAVRKRESIMVEDRVYIPQENELISEGENIGTLYALVDETEHYQYLKELERQKEIADSANAAKSRFLAQMSHEIRTPINAVLGMDEMILRESSEKDILSYAADIRMAGRTLLSLINDILDISKVEEGKMEIIPVQYELSSMIYDLVNMVRSRAAGKGLDFNVDVDGNIPHILNGDEIRIRQCVLNILTNAVKYTEKGGVRMTVSFEEAGDDSIFLTFSVADTGIGMKKEDMEFLFSPYQRIEEKRNRGIEGTGLGMSITRELLSLMDSELKVESEYGKGSVFSFTVEQGVVAREPIGDISGRFEEAISRMQSYRELFHAPDAHILVVDDTEVNLTVFRNLLKRTRVRIDTASSGKEALAMMEKKLYDVVFIDHMMPGMDGIETLKHMRESGLNRKTPAIALTANAVSGAREVYLEAGFTDYLAKPVDGERLERRLYSILPPEKRTDADPAEDKEPEKEEELPDWVAGLKGVDTEAGLANCGSAESYLSVLSVFHRTAAEKAEEIERLLEENNIADYTVRVHALKSSARIIGDNELSKLAERLEKAGKEGDAALIAEETPKLLALYRDLDRQLAGFDEPEEALRPIGEKELQEAYRTMVEIAQSMDYELMEGLLKDLGSYSLAPADQEKLARIGKLLTELDWDGIIHTVSGS